LEARIEEWVIYYNETRYCESRGNVTPQDKSLGNEERNIYGKEDNPDRNDEQHDPARIEPAFQ
jgi:hypothetical protein